ncbi:molybdate ABC transporter permease subunit [Luteolibacter flavescens]|uniref:Molybdenum transport system permease n=1 Tax=Luteolibacter flavescens TaxID=1859460 RepID=A0ABT3FUA3_9BACT|nr:molybdate ABC transporter permease subunit [Luteolibacter flavescens]MCW1887163.1 molybdate ABC transporter permease subunit [Luteolibacter flavescens]
MTAEDTRLILFTLGVSAAAVVAALPLGLALGWCLARKQWPGKALVETLVMLPMVVPPVVTGLVLLKLFGKKGPFGGLLEQWGVEVIFTWKAVVLSLAIMAFPLLLRCIRTAFEEVPRHLEEAAATLGKTPWQVFTRVSIPLARRGIAAGIVLGFARALGEFGATMMVAGLIPGVTETIPLAIYRSFHAGDDERVWMLAGVSAAIAFIALWMAGRLTKGRSL